jgi:hypothetical protein
LQVEPADELGSLVSVEGWTGTRRRSHALEISGGAEPALGFGRPMSKELIG